MYSFDAARAIEAALTEFEPDIVHFHNVGHRLTMAIVDRVASTGTPTAMTLHDYKPVCPAYDLFRDGRLCCPRSASAPVRCTSFSIGA